MITLLTWNMQGNKPETLGAYLASGKYDVVCVQESSAPLRSFDEVLLTRSHATYVAHCSSERLKDKSYTGYFIEWSRTEGGNIRCSLTTYVRNNVAHQFFARVESKVESTRPLLCVDVRGFVIGNLHNISSAPAKAQQNALDFINYCNDLRRPYCIAGDFNINALDYPALNPRNHYYHPGCKTQIKGGCLDYMYCTQNAICERVLDVPGVFSDHSPVVFTIDY